MTDAIVDRSEAPHVSGVSAARLPSAWQYQPALDGLRALAVLAVIGYHDRLSWVRGGFLGVDAFFVLSGFLITSLLIREWRAGGRISLSGFWARRAARLLPAVFLLLLAVAVYAAVALPREQLGSLRGDGLASLFYVANWRFIAAGQSYFAAFLPPSPLRHMWSLAIEEQFYLVWPIIVLVVLRGARGSLRALATVCVAGIAGSAVAMALLYRLSDPSRVYYGTDTRSHELLVGALLAVCLAVWQPATRGARRSLHALGALGALGCLWSWHSVGDHTAGLYRGGSLLFAVAVAAVIASVVQPARTPLRAAMSLTPLIWLGRISYGVYLWHWPIEVVMTPSRTRLDGASLDIARLAVTLVVAAASFYAVERPIRMAREKRVFVRAGAPAAAVALTVVLLASTAGATTQSFAGNAYGFGEPCPPPAREDVARAEAFLRARPAAAVPTLRHRPKVLIIGDSFACSLSTGLSVVGRHAGIAVANASVTGCGVVSDQIIPVNGYPPQTEHCHALVERRIATMIDRSPPDVVVWYSFWEVYDHKVKGRRVRFGSRAGDALLLARMESMYHKLTASGARLALVTDAPQVPSYIVPTAHSSQLLHLDRLYRTFAERHPQNVRVIDLVPHLCPSGEPCPSAIDGIRPRPADGAHFGPEGGAWISLRILPEITGSR